VFRWKNLRTDRRGFETELFEHTLLKGPVAAATRDAETHLSVVNADSARDFPTNFSAALLALWMLVRTRLRIVATRSRQLWAARAVRVFGRSEADARIN